MNQTSGPAAAPSLRIALLTYRGKTTVGGQGVYTRHLAKALVDHPDQVEVVVTQADGATVIELRVAEDDMGKVIGRNGSVAKALRTLLKVVGARDGEQFQLEIV